MKTKTLRFTEVYEIVMTEETYDELHRKLSAVYALAHGANMFFGVDDLITEQEFHDWFDGEITTKKQTGKWTMRMNVLFNKLCPGYVMGYIPENAFETFVDNFIKGYHGLEIPGAELSLEESTEERP